MRFLAMNIPFRYVQQDASCPKHVLEVMEPEVNHSASLVVAESDSECYVVIPLIELPVGSFREV
jgi:hypothetical protein